MEFYSATKNNDMWLESKWMQLEDIMLSEVRLRKIKATFFFSHMWKVDLKVNIYSKTNMIIYKLRYGTCL
jgi:hypothetical protein